MQHLDGATQSKVIPLLFSPMAPRFSCKTVARPISGAGVFGGFAEAAPWFAAIAQLVEHVIRNDGVTGSSPVCGTKYPAKSLCYMADTKTFRRRVFRVRSKSAYRRAPRLTGATGVARSEL
jgi:hypothetical protein